MFFLCFLMFELCPALVGRRVDFYVAWGYSLHHKDIQHFVPVGLSPPFSLLTIF